MVEKWQRQEILRHVLAHVCPFVFVLEIAQERKQKNKK
jgi:hypothetical protein